MEECAAAAEDLATWLRGGGFAPSFTPPQAGVRYFALCEEKHTQDDGYVYRTGDRRYAIMTKRYTDETEGWLFVEYDESRVTHYKTWELA